MLIGQKDHGKKTLFIKNNGKKILLFSYYEYFESYRNHLNILMVTEIYTFFSSLLPFL